MSVSVCASQKNESELCELHSSRRCHFHAGTFGDAAQPFAVGFTGAVSSKYPLREAILAEVKAMNVTSYLGTWKQVTGCHCHCHRHLLHHHRTCYTIPSADRTQPSRQPIVEGPRSRGLRRTALKGEDVGLHHRAVQHRRHTVFAAQFYAILCAVL